MSIYCQACGTLIDKNTNRVARAFVEVGEYSAASDRFDVEGEGDLITCPKCEHVNIDSFITQEDLNTLNEDALYGTVESEPSDKESHPELRALYAWLEDNVASGSDLTFDNEGSVTSEKVLKALPRLP